MVKLIDLSQQIVHQMSVHPYDDPVQLYQDKFLSTDQYNNFRLEIGMHAGTHIDAPMHLIDSQTFIDQIKLDTFIGQGCLLDVRDQILITYKEEYFDLVAEDDIVLLWTNHSDQYGSESYYTEHPIIDRALADFFIEKKIKMLGMDLPSPDSYPFEVHQMLFNHNILVIENMTNLKELSDQKKFEIIAFPLKIRAEASLVRVIAKISI